MAGRNINPYGFGLFKVHVADLLTDLDIRKLATYFAFPPALKGDGLDFVNTLVRRDIINETDISKLLIALKELELYGIQKDLQKTFKQPRVEQVSSPLKPSPTPEEGEPPETITIDDTKPVFISFSSKDLAQVQEIVATFEEALGPNTCWMYTTGIKGGQNIDRQIVRALAEAQVVVCVISQDYIDSNECEKEVLLAEQRGKEIIAVHVESVKRPYQDKHGVESALQLRFARRLYIRLTGKDMEKEMKKLILRIKELISQEDNQSTEQVPSPLKPSPTPEGGEPSKTSTDEQVPSPLKPSPTPEGGDPLKTSTDEQVSSPLEPSPTPEGEGPSKTSTVEFEKNILPS